MENLIIRNETENDYRIVENITREAFWNLNAPGCSEHYIVHIMRRHEDFIPELDYVAELGGKVIGNIMYTKAKLIDEKGGMKQILTFGPISIHPDYQRKGYSKILLEYSFEKATKLGYDIIVIFGNPANYISRGFKSCKKYNICTQDNVYPSAMMVKELKNGASDGRKWYYKESELYNIDNDEAEKFDELFECKEKKYRLSQEEFYIHSHSIIN